MIRYCIPHYTNYINSTNFTFSRGEVVPQPPLLSDEHPFFSDEKLEHEVYHRYYLRFENGEESYCAAYDMPASAIEYTRERMLRMYLADMFFHLTYYSENPLFGFPTFYKETDYIKELSKRATTHVLNGGIPKDKDAILALTAKYENDAINLAKLYGEENFYGTYEIFRKNRRQRIAVID